MSDPPASVVPFKSQKALADETLVAALERLLEDARSGRVDRLLCVCSGDSSSRLSTVRYRAHDLALLGAVSVALAGLQSEWTVEWGS